MASKIVIELDEQQSQQLFELLDIATKAGGLGVAKAAMPIADLLMQAVKAYKGNEPDELLASD